MKIRHLLTTFLASLALHSCVQLTPEQLAFRQSEYALAVAQMSKSNAKAEEFLPHLHNAADLYLPEAQFALGQVYSDGRYVAPNWYEAVRWYERAGHNGVFPAQQILANVYHFGRPGVSYSYSEAIYWYKRAARNGDTDAGATAGFLLLQTAYSISDYRDALYWLERAGREGNYQARRASYDLADRIRHMEERERRKREREERRKEKERQARERQEQIKPVQPTKPTKPTKPEVKPEKPEKPVKPAPSVKPEEKPAKPLTPAKPAEPKPKA